MLTTEATPLSLFEHWAELRAILAGQGVDIGTVELARNAFYCGAASAIACLFDPTTTSRPDPHVIAGALLQLRDELHAYRYDARGRGAR